MDTMSSQSRLASAKTAARIIVGSESVAWLIVFALATYLASLPQLTPTVPGTELRLISYPFAFLNIAFALRPKTEAALYALVYLTVSLVSEPHNDHLGFAAARAVLEIIQAGGLVFLYHRSLRNMLSYPVQVVVYQAGVLAILALGALATVTIAELPLMPASVYADEMAGNPALAWRHWWLGNSCAYLTIAGPAVYLVARRHKVGEELRGDPENVNRFVGMATALFISGSLFLSPFDLNFPEAPDVRLALMFIPAPIAFVMAACYRSHGLAAAMLILTPLAIMSAAGPHWAGLPPMATPIQVFLIVTAIGCNVIAAVTLRFQRAVEEAESASEAKARFVAMLNHELRTPLNAILGFSELMRIKNIRDMDEAIGPIENIHASGQRLLAMIEGLLNQADRGAGAFEIHRHPLNLTQTIEAGVDCIQQHMPGASDCPMEISAMEDIMIDADPKALKQILFMLLSYPIRFSGPDAKVKVSAKRIGTDTITEIASTGLIRAVVDDRDKIEMQLVSALALAHGARLVIAEQSRESRVVRVTFFATHAH
jgi:signal transduction histidine kinase